MSSVELGIMLFEASIQMDRMCKNFELFSSDWGKSIGTVDLYILSIKAGLPLSKKVKELWMNQILLFLLGS